MARVGHSSRADTDGQDPSTAEAAAEASREASSAAEHQGRTGKERRDHQQPFLGFGKHAARDARSALGRPSAEESATDGGQQQMKAREGDEAQFESCRCRKSAPQSIQ